MFSSEVLPIVSRLKDKGLSCEVFGSNLSFLGSFRECLDGYMLFVLSPNEKRPIDLKTSPGGLTFVPW
jgi:hypothetical protein